MAAGALCGPARTGCPLARPLRAGLLWTAIVRSVGPLPLGRAWLALLRARLALGGPVAALVVGPSRAVGPLALLAGLVLSRPAGRRILGAALIGTAVALAAPIGVPGPLAFLGRLLGSPVFLGWDGRTFFLSFGHYSPLP